MRNTSRTKVCVIGAGAIGGFFGARLANGHADVSVIARGATLAALQTRGWVLEGSGDRIAAPVRATADPAELGPQDIVILAVKAPALTQIAALVHPLLGPSTLVVPALNGVPWWFTLGHAGLTVNARLASVDPQGLPASTQKPAPTSGRRSGRSCWATPASIRSACSPARPLTI